MDLYVLVFVMTLQLGNSSMVSYGLTNTPPTDLRSCIEMVKASFSDLRCININDPHIEDAVREKYGDKFYESTGNN